MKAKALLIVIVAAFTAALIGCGGGGGKTPEDAVKGMMEAVKAKDHEKAVSFMDLEGLVKLQKEGIEKQLEGIEDEEMKKEMQKQLDEITVEKFKDEMIKAMKEDPKGTDFTYKIKETKDGEDGTKIVVVEVTEKDKEPEEVKFPVKKVNGGWKIDPMAMGEMD